MLVQANDTTTNRTAAPAVAAAAPAASTATRLSEDRVILSRPAAVAAPAAAPSLLSQAGSTVSAYASSAKKYVSEKIEDLSELVSSTWAMIALRRVFSQLTEGRIEGEKEESKRKEDAGYQAQVANAAAARKAYADSLYEKGRKAAN